MAESPRQFVVLSHPSNNIRGHIRPRHQCPLRIQQAQVTATGVSWSTVSRCVEQSVSCATFTGHVTGQI